MGSPRCLLDWSSGDTAGLVSSTSAGRDLISGALASSSHSCRPTGAFPDLDLRQTRYREAQPALERLRARKSPASSVGRELRSGSSTRRQLGPPGMARGITRRELASAVRREEEKRELHFEYCLVTTGTSLNRVAFRSPLGEWWHSFARLRRQFGRLHRRCLPDGHPRRARH